MIRPVLLASTLALFAIAACSDDDPGTDAGVPPTPDWGEAFDAQSTGWLLASWASANNDVFMVGGAPDDGLIMHFDGSAWSELALGATYPLINWGYGFGANDVTFVGSKGTVLHYDGSSFTEQTTPTDQDLWGVWGAAKDDLWAVGGIASRDGQPTILHYDGIEWTKSATPTLSRPNVRAYFKVWGTATNNVYVVGQQGALAHWDGSAWTEVESGTSEDLVSLWGTGPDNIVIVGGRNAGQIVTYDGASWKAQSLAPLPALNGVWMRDPKKAHIGGIQGTLATLDLDTMEAETEETSTFLTIHNMFGTPGGQLYAVGGSLLDVRPPYKGVALTRELLDSE